jgi:exonuclease SbcC
MEVAELNKQLSDGDFSPDARAVQADAQSRLEHLQFDPDRLAKLEELVGEGTVVDASHHLLLGARQDRVQTEAERDQAEGHVMAAQKELCSGTFSSVLDSDCQRLSSEREVLGYDATRHDLVRVQVAALTDAPVQQEQLLAARQRTQATNAALQRLQDDLAGTAKRIEVLDHRRVELIVIIESLKDVDDNCRVAQECVENHRHERDELLQLQGSLLSRQQQLRAVAEQSALMAVRRVELERDEWIFRQLVEAFGKNGIQALVIESAIPEIEDEANAILRRLTDNRIHVFRRRGFPY